MHELDPVRGAPKIFGSRKLSRALETWLLGRAGLVLAITEYMARYAIERGANPVNVRIFRHITAFAEFGSRSNDFDLSESIQETPPILGVVSRLSKQKYIYDLIDIASRLKARGIEFTMLVAGDGEERANLERRIKSEGLVDRIRLLGFLNENALLRLHSRTTVHLSLICGASLIEACLAACCVVGYDVEWQSEIVKTDITGILVPVGDTDAAAQAVAQLIQKPIDQRRLGEGARVAALTMFDPQKLREAHCAIYRELAANSAA